MIVSTKTSKKSPHTVELLKRLGLDKPLTCAELRELERQNERYKDQLRRA